MIKKNKLTILLTSVITLLPALLGLFGSKILPAEVVEFWGMDTSSGTASIFWILPLILLALHWLCIILTAVKEKSNEQSKVAQRLVLWIIPVLSLTVCGTFLAIAASPEINIYALILMPFGIGFMIMGNYMPKVTRNRTVGIRIYWTLANQDNWTATHRFTGKVFFIGGLAALLSILLPVAVQPFAGGVILVVILVLPIVYSYRFYKKQLRDGTATKQDYEQGLHTISKNSKAAVIATVVVIASLCIIMPLIMFTGDVEITAGESAIEIEADGWRNCTLPYDQIESVEYREHTVDGQRINGVGSARLLLGVFRNTEFGTYIRYTYTGDLPCIVLRSGGETYVLATNDAQATEALYGTILEKIEK